MATVAPSADTSGEEDLLLTCAGLWHKDYQSTHYISRETNLDDTCGGHEEPHLHLTKRKLFNPKFLEFKTK